MEENDASFENDSDGNVKANDSTQMDGGKPNVEKLPGGFSMDFDTGSGKGEANTNTGSGKVEVDLSEKAQSTGKHPTGEGKPLTGEAGDALNGFGSGGSGGSSSSGGPRVDEDRTGSRSGTPGKRVYNNIGELEKEVEEERKNIKEIVGNLVKKCKEQQEALQGKINQAGSKHNGLATGVFDKLPLVPPVPSPVPRPVPPGAGQEPKTPPNAPLGQKVRRTYFHLEFAKVNALPASKPLVDIAQETFEKADQLCTVGDLNNGNQALETVDTLTQAALSPDLQPSPPGSPAPPGSDSETEQRANAQNAGLDLYRSANSLNDAGFPNLASSLRITAGDLLNFGLGLARSSKLLDLPFNLMEGFAGKTIEFNDDGEAVLRDATTFERVFALAGIALAVGAVVTGGLPALIGASVLSSLDKETAEKLAKLASQIKDKIRKGESFDIPDIPGYLEKPSRPNGPFTYRPTPEAKALRPSANKANKKFRKDNSLTNSKDIEIHHKHPIKWGGDPTDPNNLEALDKPTHNKKTSFWNALQRAVEKAK
jgi:hypothetical protein